MIKKDFKDTTEETQETKQEELTEEEVNLYGGCGEDRYRCHNDCIIPYTSLLNSSL